MKTSQCVCPSEADGLPLSSAVTKSLFSRTEQNNNRRRHWKQRQPRNVQHEDKSMKSIWLLSFKCQPVGKKEHFSEPYQNLLILCDIFQQFPPLCKCLPAIWFKQMPRLHSTTTGGDFLFGLLLNFYLSETKSPTKNIGWRFFRERMKEMGFVDKPSHLRDQTCVFWWDITPRRWNVAAWPHAVAPNSEQYSCIPRFCATSLSCTRGATGKVQSSGSQQRALYSTAVPPLCFYGCWGTSI